MAIDADTPAFDVAEAAAYLKLSVESIRKYIQKGRIKPAMTVGRAYIILRAECDRFSATRKGPGNPNFQRKVAMARKVRKARKK